MKYLFAVILVIFLHSCNKEDTPEVSLPVEPQDYTMQNEAEIIAYLEENNLVAQKSETGLYYIIENQGGGLQATSSSNVTVSYKGYLLDGYVFDENLEGFTTDLDTLISGFSEGVSYLNEGGNGVFLIPAHLGFGSYYYNSIPGGSVIIFEIELFSIN